MTTPTTPTDAMVEAHTAWLCEYTISGTPHYWGYVDGLADWITDHDAALQFARKQDAQNYIDDIGWTEVVPIEHMWIGPRAAALQHQEPGGTVEPSAGKRAGLEAAAAGSRAFREVLATPPAPSALDRAVEEARTAGFNEAKERAVEIASRESGTLQPALQSPETRTRFRVAQTIATALQAMKQGRRALEEGTGR